MTPHRIAVIVGSLRKGSFNRKIANHLVKTSPQTLKLEIVEIRELSMYDQDLDEDPPQAWRSFRERIRSFDGVLFVTPEYNRSVPAVLKNAIDIGSRPPRQNIWAGKPCAVISVSPGHLGGFGANHHLRQSLMALNMPTMAQPEIYLGDVAAALDEKGEVTKESTKELLGKFLGAFSKWVDVHLDSGRKDS